MIIQKVAADTNQRSLVVAVVGLLTITFLGSDRSAIEKIWPGVTQTVTSWPRVLWIKF